MLLIVHAARPSYSNNMTARTKTITANKPDTGYLQNQTDSAGRNTTQTCNRDRRSLTGHSPAQHNRTPSQHEAVHDNKKPTGAPPPPRTTRPRGGHHTAPPEPLHHKEPTATARTRLHRQQRGSRRNEGAELRARPLSTTTKSF